MLRYYVKRSGGEEYQQTEKPPADNVWVHGEVVDESELRFLAKHYNLDLNILRDVLDANELARVETHDDALYVFVRTAHRARHGQVITTPVLLAVRGNVFINVSTSNFDDHKMARPGILSKSGDINDILLNTFAVVVSEYENLIQRSSRYIKDTGQRLRTHEVTNQDFIKFVTVEDNLNEYKMNLNSMLVVAQRLQELFKNTEDSEAVEDILLYIRQLLVAIESHSQTVTSIRNAYSTIADNNLNKRMKTLTVLTLLVALPNVFYGMYGMNVALPFQDQPWAYSLIVVFTIILILGIYALAKRIRLF